jgi:hypothetical protein
MVVLSPPGIIRASQRARSSTVRTSIEVIDVEILPESWEDACLRRERCSWKPPCKARTPTVRDMAVGRC